MGKVLQDQPPTDASSSRLSQLETDFAPEYEQECLRLQSYLVFLVFKMRQSYSFFYIAQKRLMGFEDIPAPGINPRGGGFGEERRKSVGSEAGE